MRQVSARLIPSPTTRTPKCMLPDFCGCHFPGLVSSRCLKPVPILRRPSQRVQCARAQSRPESVSGQCLIIFPSACPFARASKGRSGTTGVAPGRSSRTRRRPARTPQTARSFHHTTCGESPTWCRTRLLYAHRCALIASSLRLGGLLPRSGGK